MRVWCFRFGAESEAKKSALRTEGALKKGTLREYLLGRYFRDCFEDA